MYCFLKYLIVSCICVLVVCQKLVIDGSFTQHITIGKVNSYSELYQTGNRDFVYKYFGKIYELVVDVPPGVDELKAYHVCSDMMLTIFLQSELKNIWQCDFVGAFESPIKMACQNLGKTNNTICSDRHQRNPPIFIKKDIKPENAETASINWIEILICCILVVLMGFLVFVSVFTWKNFTNVRNVKTSETKDLTETRKPKPSEGQSKRKPPATITAANPKTKSVISSSYPLPTISLSTSTTSNDKNLQPETEVKPPKTKLSTIKDSSENHVKPFASKTPSKIKTLKETDDSVSLLNNDKNINLQTDSETDEIELSLLKIGPKNVRYTKKKMHESKLNKAEEKHSEEQENIHDNEILSSNECYENMKKYARDLKSSNEEYENIKSSNVLHMSSTATPASTLNVIVDQTHANYTDGVIVPDILFNVTATHFITIGEKFVTIYDKNSKQSRSFPAAVDYGKNPAVIGVDYISPTVITSNNYFDDTNLQKEEVIDTNQSRQYFVFHAENNLTKKINKNSVIVDLLKEAASCIISNSIILTIPSHLTNDQKSLFLKAANDAGFIDIDPLDENLALAYGIREFYDVKGRFIVIRQYQLEMTIFVYENKIVYQETINNENSESKVFNWYDGIIDEAEGGKKDLNNTNLSCANPVFEIMDLFVNNSNQDSVERRVFIVDGNPFHNILADKYFSLIFTVVKYPQKIVNEGIKALCT